MTRDSAEFAYVSVLAEAIGDVARERATATAVKKRMADPGRRASSTTGRWPSISWTAYGSTGG